VASSSLTASARPTTPLVLTALGAAVLAGTLAVDPKTAVVGAVAFLFAAVIAIRETSTTLVTWPNALIVLLLIVWLIPIKQYRLPVTLPFNLELYRIAVLVLMLGFVLGVATGRLPLTAAGHAKPLAALIVVAVVSQVVNWDTLDVPGASPVALKSLSYFLSFIAVFLLVVAAIQRFADAALILVALVVGGVVVSLAAIIESRTRSNLFSNLDDWVPILVKETREVEELRGGRLRVRASAQHPIALGVAVTMVIPIALVLARHAASRARSIALLIAAAICAMGALVTVSRTVVAMGIVMAALGLLLRPQQVLRLWPVLIVLPPLAHAAAPGTLGGLYKSIFPREGLAADLQGRAGLGGSGRLDDIDPGLDLWRDSPLVGHGLGFVSTTTHTLVEGASAGATGFIVIFDNQYMSTLVQLGALGIAAAVWFVWGAAIKLARAARQHREGPEADIVAATAISCAGFAASMLFFDAFAFVQATLIFFIIAAVGLRVRELGLDKAPVIPLEDRRARAPGGSATKGLVTG
jgi:O-antigen ligase/polysaccharide polymerase Wzy-like membrane protein